MESIAVKYRTVSKVVAATSTLEGDGVPIRRAFPGGLIEDLDPFLLLDHMGPFEMRPGDGRGFPDHPHRGFETVTYVLKGQFQHRDSYGNRGLLGPGDIQWMTAGSGLVHSELPGPDIARNGGILEGFQLWINLPRRDKMTAPRYQELKGAEIPVIEDGGAKVRVIAGESSGKRGLIETRIPVTYLHVTLAPGAQYVQAVPRGQNAFAYVVGGEVEFAGGSAAKQGDVAIFANDGDEIALSAPAAASGDANVLLIAGQPLNEPVARYGPFVMNTRQELVQAFEDFQNGKMGRL